jgi:hypothetical protein
MGKNEQVRKCRHMIYQFWCVQPSHFHVQNTYRPVVDEQTDGQTDMAKLTGVFLQCLVVNALKKRPVKIATGPIKILTVFLPHMNP